MPLAVTLGAHRADFQTTVEVNYCYVWTVQLEYVFNFL